MYAIAFNFDVAALGGLHHGASWAKSFGQIAEVLQGFGFAPQQGSLYFGNKDVTAVSCVLAVQALDRELPWFSQSVRDIRMLRIDELNDLSYAIPDRGKRLAVA